MRRNGTTRGIQGGYNLCFECLENKRINKFQLAKAKAKSGVHFSLQICDDCIIKARQKVKEQVIDCRVEDNLVVKTLQPGNYGEGFDLYSTMVHSGIKL